MWSKIKYSVFLFAMLSVGSLSAQNPADVEMADVLRQNGKIYVVVIIASLVFAGMVIYLIYLDRKLRKLEKEMKK